MQPLLIALQFLTSLPVRLPGLPEPGQMGRSLLYFPLVGALLGALLWLASLALAGAPLLLQAGLLLALWIGLSGFLHLDGLADSADAWLGGFGERERTLEIMKDPRSGPVAIVVLVLVLLLKFAALAALLEQGVGLALILVPVLGRSSLLALFLSTPYVRRGGLGEAMAEHLPRRAACAVLALVALAALLAGFWLALLAALLAFIVLRRQLLRRLGGTTGDTAGALLELLEVLVLVVLVIQ
ncbi:adenosylcobinamide-GDP ribazoletransferase [Stutzerimonas kirkiae]|uniref:Adenosylcobinamide-GDP ribazoletransferase n=1 Tax=Stutzerimonas kirkiae TaxID=2211392 RepID=A0A4Q9R9H8_9GAMM|nr:adenosylcobinamide-GDP ribazoletransferase [Stutzerimonas kirkiae]TBU97327.1 adenosylcobinamide-GDP ribazoletransferase [Stutzerimonas kirkiae]TBV02959.1 adenosylcobinamide-GDP ribazoletransferase [Stutzerimonas kirkiae]TBV06644.1 adenosylcobinamide-GDP ribazoletransferase [Stutzerimonas kirkiae]TBV13060.1 adenosylcobinamide-GDP ribazoletransferase [Stutzerimonas kirkiae]